MGAHHHAPPPPCCGVAKRKEKEKRGWKKRARTRGKGVVFVGDFAACEGDTSVRLMIRLGEKGA